MQPALAQGTDCRPDSQGINRSVKRRRYHILSYFFNFKLPNTSDETECRPNTPPVNYSTCHFSAAPIVFVRVQLCSRIFIFMQRGSSVDGIKITFFITDKNGIWTQMKSCMYAQHLRLSHWSSQHCSTVQFAVHVKGEAQSSVRGSSLLCGCTGV